MNSTHQPVQPDTEDLQWQGEVLEVEAVGLVVLLPGLGRSFVDSSLGCGGS